MLRVWVHGVRAVAGPRPSPNPRDEVGPYLAVGDSRPRLVLGSGTGLGRLGLPPGDLLVEGYPVRVRPLPFGGTGGGDGALGLRITDPDSGCSVAWLPRHGPLGAGPGPLGLGAFHHDAVELAYGADLLIHGAMFADAEVGEAAARGESTVGYAAGLAQRCRVGRLVLVHHHPDRSDDVIQALAAAAGAGTALAVTAAREGQRFDVGLARRIEPDTAKDS